MVLSIRWYLSYKLSYRDLVAMRSERGIAMAHTTILRWVQHYTPELQKRWNRFARPVRDSWRRDETYICVKGEWMHLYRAVDKAAKRHCQLVAMRTSVIGDPAQWMHNGMSPVH